LLFASVHFAFPSLLFASVQIAVALAQTPYCLADPSASHSPQSNLTTSATAGARRDNATAVVLPKIPPPSVPRGKWSYIAPLCNVKKKKTALAPALKFVRPAKQCAKTAFLAQYSSKPTVALISV
jgi:hypothetical protein